MAGFESIAGVSSSLRNLLRDRMEGTVSITIAAPDVTVTGVTGQRVNLYLYQVSENGYLKNQEIPGEGHPADYGHPPLSLDLSYLVTAHGGTPAGADADLQAQQVLGDTMRVFHEYPLLTDDLHEHDDPLQPPILDPSLAGEFERIKITLQPNPLDELTKVWSALPETAFRRSVVYQVSVIQIESRRRRRGALPVRRRAVYAFPLQSPFIAELFRDPPFDDLRSAVVQVGDTLVITGRNLAGPGSRVRLGDVQVTAFGVLQERRLELVVPGTITSGTHTVQVVRDFLLDAEESQPPEPHRGFESNVVPLLVLPTFQGISPGSASAGDTVTVAVDPPIAADQSRSLLLGDVEIPGVPVLVGSPPSGTAEFVLPTGAGALPVGDHFVRVRIDGAESRLSVDSTTGDYDGPSFTVNP